MIGSKWVTRLGLLLVLCLGPSVVVAQSVEIPDSLPPGVDAEMVREGYRIFHNEGLCVACHGEAGRGLIGPDLTDSDWWHAKGSFLSIVMRVLRGVPEEASSTDLEMPPLGGSDIGEDDVLAVSAWVWRAGNPSAKLPLGVTPSLIERGEKVFHGVGECADCHGDDAAGDEAPDLTDRDWLHAKGSYLSIVGMILKGVPASISRSGVVMPPKGGSGITDKEAHSVAAYVWVSSRRN